MESDLSCILLASENTMIPAIKYAVLDRKSKGKIYETACKLKVITL